MNSDEPTPGDASVARDDEPGARKVRRRRRRSSTPSADTPARPAITPEADGDRDPPPVAEGRAAGSRKKRTRRTRKRQDDDGESSGSGRARKRPKKKTRKKRAARKSTGDEGVQDQEPDVDIPPIDGEEAAERPKDTPKDTPKDKPKDKPREKGRGKRPKRRSERAESGERGKRKSRSGERRPRRRKSESETDRRRGRTRRGTYTRDARALDIVPHAPGPQDRREEKVLLVNATDREEARIALLVDGRLDEIFVEAVTEKSATGNIYRGRIQNVERGIGAAFVDIGRGVTGFLHAADMPIPTDEAEAEVLPIDRLTTGDEVVVQITRDSIGRKGPALTGRVSLPGRYLVLMPFTERSGISRRIPHGRERERVRKLLRKLELPEGMGIIVRTASESTDLAALEADRDHLLSEWERIRQRAAEPGGPGVLRGESDLAERSVRDIMPGEVTRIVVDKEETAGQIHRLLRIWYPSQTAAAEAVGHATVRAATAAAEVPLGEIANPKGTALDEEVAPPVEEEPPVDELDEEDRDDNDELAAGIAPEIDIEPDEEYADDEAEPDSEPEDDEPDEDDEDEEDEGERLAQLRVVARAMPDVELHTDSMPLFHAYNVETQLEDAFRRSIRLPSGGSIVIDPTEALVSIDVNSGRLTDAEDPERTALVTNLEAVTEAARQLRLRDLGGLVVLDFIDMRERSSQRDVENAFREALSHDRARIRLGRMGPFGLMVLSRQRIRRALTRVTHEDCPSCGGTGRRRHIPGLGLRVLREMQARVARSRGRGGLEVRAPAEVCGWIRKHRSGDLRQIKRSCNGPITLEPDDRLARDGWAMKGLAPEGETDEE